MIAGRRVALVAKPSLEIERDLYEPTVIDE
jgi:hypothetical protein